MGNLSAESLHHAIKNTLFVAVQNVTGVQNAGGGESGQALGGVLLKVLLSEDVSNVLAEINVVDKGGIC